MKYLAGDVNRAEFIQGLCNQPVAEVRGCHISRERVRRVSALLKFRQHLLCGRFIEIIDDDRSAFVGKFQRNGATDAASEEFRRAFRRYEDYVLPHFMLLKL
jgi:hypothetical protein